MQIREATRKEIQEITVNTAAPTNETRRRGGLQQRDVNFEFQKQFVKELYALCDLNEEFRTSAQAMSDTLQIPQHVIQNTIRFLDEKGVVKRRQIHGPHGIEAYWTLIQPYEKAADHIDRFQESSKNKIRRRNGGSSTTSTPLNPPTNDWHEAKTWVNNARAYMTRIEAVGQKIKELKALGIDVDEQMIYRAVDIKHDDTLSTLALIVPYVDYLENKILNSATKRRVNDVERR
jgi:predicted transcriptional regulator